MPLGEGSDRLAGSFWFAKHEFCLRAGLLKSGGEAGASLECDEVVRGIGIGEGIAAGVGGKVDLDGAECGPEALEAVGALPARSAVGRFRRALRRQAELVG